MQSAELPNQQLHQRVKRELEVMGQSTETVPAHEQPVLRERLGLPDVNIIPEGVQNFVLGTNIDSHVGVTHAGRWSRLVNSIRGVKERFRRK